MADSTDLDVVDGADAGPVSGVPGTKPNSRKGLLIGIAAVGALVLVASGAYLFRGSPALGGDPIPTFRKVMDEQSGFKSQDDNPGNFERKSDFSLDSSDPKEMPNGGFVTLIEYQDEDAARVGQDKWSQNTSQQAGFEEKEADGIRIVSSRNPDDITPEVYRGTGVLSVQFGKYRFESHGDRDKLDDLVDELEYLDAGRSDSDPFPQFAKAVRASGLTSQTVASGYAARSSYTKGNTVVECVVFWSRDAADQDFERQKRWLEKEDSGDYRVSGGRGFWFITKWTGLDEKEQKYYTVRVYRGKTMIAVSTPVADRKKADALVRKLTR